MNISPKLDNYVDLCMQHDPIDNELFAKFHVNRGLRDAQGRGVLTGLTHISDIYSKKEVDGKTEYCDGVLAYRGIPIQNIVSGFYSEKRFGFEEVTYLLLFGELPKKSQLEEFEDLLAQYRTLPTGFVRDVIMKAPSADMMNSLARSVLTLHSYDDNANDISLQNVLGQCLQLIAVFPLLAVYGYHAHMHYHCNESMFIHLPDPTKSTAENILQMLRPDQKYTELEARVLDMSLVLHAEHGGGNNSTFTTHVVTSTGTDTYSAIASALASLKGPRHGGANIKAKNMIDEMKKNVKDWKDEDEIASYLIKILDKKAFDRSGLIYGIGHAIYTISDPREKILKQFVEQLSNEKNRHDEFALYASVDKLSPILMTQRRNTVKPVCANIDFYSGFVYDMLGLPEELFTPIFAIARISGWSAHRIEELVNFGKIIRPAFENVCEPAKYIKLKDR